MAEEQVDALVLAARFDTSELTQGFDIVVASAKPFEQAIRKVAQQLPAAIYSLPVALATEVVHRDLHLALTSEDHMDIEAEDFIGNWPLRHDTSFIMLRDCAVRSY